MSRRWLAHTISIPVLLIGTSAGTPFGHEPNRSTAKPSAIPQPGNQDRRDEMHGVKAGLSPLLEAVQSDQEDETVSLTSAQFVSDTTDENKDHDTGVFVEVRTRENLTIVAVAENADYSDDDSTEYRDWSRHEISLILSHARFTKGECRGFRVTVSSRAKGNDTWKFSATVILTFSDGSSLEAARRNLSLESRGSSFVSSTFQSEPPTGTVQSPEHLAVKYAPIVFHDPEETNLPANVDWFLSRTSLWFQDSACKPVVREKILDNPSQADLVRQTHQEDCGQQEVRSNGTRSKGKQRTFYLADLPESERAGSLDPRDWTTYYHIYKNHIGGITIQYWRLYAYNTGKSVLGIRIGFHGGDWEAIHVVLDKSETPTIIRLLGHTSIVETAWNQIEREGTHPVIFAERGGHASLAHGPRTGIRHETWGARHGGKVVWRDGRVLEAGGMINVGEKAVPLSGQVFIQYSGLWGSPSRLPITSTLFYFASSGYWGPAYNETGMEPSGFITAWGKGARDPNQVLDGVKEFYASATSR